MRIGIDISVLNDKNKTGIAVYTYELINALLKINRKDKFILFGIATFATYDYLKNINFKKYPNVELKIIKQPAKFFRTSFLLWQKLNWPKMENFVGQIDILHSFNWNLPPVKNAKIVATVFDMTPELFPQFHENKTVQLDLIRLERIKKYADLVITISENSKKDFLQFAQKEWVEVIYPGVSDIFFDKLNKYKTQQILRKYNLTSGYILSVGTLEPRKNIKNIIEAYLKSGVKEKLVLAGGSGWKNSELTHLLENNKEKIITTGFVLREELPYLYKQASCLVYPSFYEGFGIPILEAQASGCPVITSSISSLPEAGGTGAIYVDPYSVEDIVCGIKECLSWRRGKLIKEGYKNLKKFSWEVSAKKLNLLYQKL